MRSGWHLADCCRDRNQAVVARRYVEDLAFVMDGTPQVHPLAGDGNDHLIQVPPPRPLAQYLRAGWIPTFGSSMECAPKVRFATDSALEGTGFELLVRGRVKLVVGRRRQRDRTARRSRCRCASVTFDQFVARTRAGGQGHRCARPSGRGPRRGRRFIARAIAPGIGIMKVPARVPL